MKRCRLWARVGLLILLTHSATAAEPKRVLLLESFGPAFAPFDAFLDGFRTELGRQLPEPVDFYEVSLESARFSGSSAEEPLVGYLRALFAERPPALVVTVGGPAVRFAQKNREQLFPTTPLLFACVDQRHLAIAQLTTNDAVVAVAVDFPAAIQNILRILPETTNVVVVIGNSPVERFWLDELRREIVPFTNRVGFLWLNDLSFPEMRKRVAEVPPHSAIFNPMFAVDAKGIPYVEQRTLSELHAAALAPIFGVMSSQLGQGIVGGPLLPIRQLSRDAAEAAARILGGETPGKIRPPPLGMGTPTFDWRELRRWGIRESALPPGSQVQFRQPTFWQLYRWWIIAGGSVFVLEAILILVLLLHRAKRHRAEKSLRDSEHRLRSILDTAVEGIITFNERGIIDSANPATEKIFGYRAGELVGQNVSILMPPSVREEHDHHLGNYWRTLESKVIGVGQEVIGRRKDGSNFPMDWHVSEVKLAAGSVFTGFVRDISERKRTEEQLLQLRQQLWHADRVAQTGAITASLAHEINQPLAAILSNAQAGLRFMAGENFDRDEIREILTDIVNDDKRAGTVIHGLRSLLRRRETQREPIRLADAVREIFDLLYGELLGRQVERRLHLEADCRVVADKSQIQQVILNLAMNAIEAMNDQPAGQRQLHVTLTHTSDGAAQVAVRDSGPGIPEDQQAKLFEAFWTTKEQGLGIGLPISRSIIESHGGRIWFANNPDRGVTFYFALPCQVDHSTGVK